MEYCYNLLKPILIAGLSLDLLYLYYICGVWYDPNRATEVIELVLLCVMLASGIVEAVLRVRDAPVEMKRQSK